MFGLVAASALLIAADEKKPVKLTKPWSQLTTLSDDQKDKISDIHQKANAARNEIDKKEESDITALLSDPQKAELKKIHDDERTAAKEKRAEQSKDSGKSSDK
ncbi:MAG TPA: hypothetical protein VH518_05430 [Tepidisphaeraceae bacterium]|jgi:Spy/CpxP family protein refolding chaperone